MTFLFTLGCFAVIVGSVRYLWRLERDEREDRKARALDFGSVRWADQRRMVAASFRPERGEWEIDR